MQILVTGNRGSHVKGFSLIELLTVLVIVGIIASLARLAIPDSHRRVWENETRQLVSILNQANDESISLGVSLEAVIDQQGWKFYRFNLKQERVVMGDIYQPYFWERTTSVDGLATFMMDELSTSPNWQLTLKRDEFTSHIRRDSSGRFFLSGQ